MSAMSSSSYPDLVAPALEDFPAPVATDTALGSAVAVKSEDGFKDPAVPLMIDTATGLPTLRQDAKEITEERLVRLQKLSETPEAELSNAEQNEKKRIIRLEKNRKAAATSRRKKKLYIQTLEEKYGRVRTHLGLLEGENNQLREVVNELAAKLYASREASLHLAATIDAMRQEFSAAIQSTASETIVTDSVPDFSFPMISEVTAAAALNGSMATVGTELATEEASAVGMFGAYTMPPLDATLSISQSPVSDTQTHDALSMRSQSGEPLPFGRGISTQSFDGIQSLERMDSMPFSADTGFTFDPMLVPQFGSFVDGNEFSAAGGDPMASAFQMG